LALIEKLRTIPHIKIILTVIIIAGFSAAIFPLFSRGPHYSPHDAYFTVDDGATYFKASDTNVPPYDYNGNEADRCFLFQGNREIFVGYLLKFTPDAKTSLAQSGHPAEVMSMTHFAGALVKRPGDGTWVPLDSNKGLALARVRSPDAIGTEELAKVVP
jgi:hypothetical protein